MSGKVRNITLTGLGIALFVVFTLCLQVPVFENYYLCLGYIVMAVWLYSVGTISGTIVGTAGVILYCLLTGGLRGMPGWAAGNILIGIMVGSCFRITKRMENRLPGFILAGICILAACALGILGVKSLTESFLYAQPMAVRIVKNSFAFTADAAVLLLSLPVCAVTENRLLKEAAV